MNPPAQHLHGGLDLLQGIAAFMRQTRDHLADGGEALGAQRLFLGQLALRQIARHHDKPQKVSRLIAQGVHDHVRPEERGIFTHTPALFLEAADMTAAMAGMDRTMAMPPRSVVALGLLFAMWWVMMVGMMLPGVAPVILTFATINRQRRARHQPYVPAALFAAGYLLAWGGFSVAATLNLTLGLRTRRMLARIPPPNPPFVRGDVRVRPIPPLRRGGQGGLAPSRSPRSRRGQEPPCIPPS